MDRVLSWPEADRAFRVSGASEVFVRYRVRDLAIDQFRIAYETEAAETSPVDIVQEWDENGARKHRRVRVPAGTRVFMYGIDIGSTVAVSNQAVVFECPAKN